MKKKITILLIAFTMNAFAQIPTSGLVGYYPFTGNVNDLSGNNNNGTLTGATLTIDRFGNPNSSYSFNGISDKIQIANSSSLQFTSNLQTISFWIKIPAIPSPLYIEPVIEKYDQYLSIDANGNAGQGYVVQFDGSGNLHYSFKNGISHGWGDCVILSGNFFANQNYHITFTNDNDSLRGFVNCVKVTSSKIPVGTSIGTNTVSLLIGNSIQTSAGNNVSPFVGILDDVRFYDRALNSTEVCSLNNEGLFTGFNPITPIANQNTVSVYPNPANDKIHIDFQKNNLDSNYSLDILNTLGQVVFKSSNLEEKNSFDLSNLIKGIYFVRLVDAQLNTVNIKKIILQ